MLLAINTTGRPFGIALLGEGGEILAEQTLTVRGKARFAALMPALDFTLKAAGLSLKQIRCLAVALGPGSFTGLRVGLAAAKGLSHGLALPLIGIRSLEALALQAPWTETPVAALVDSRREEVFLARFHCGNPGDPLLQEEERALLLKELPGLFPHPTLFIGDDPVRLPALLQEILGARCLLAPLHLWGIRAASVGALALRRWRLGDLDDPRTLSPRYLRPPDIRPNPYGLADPSAPNIDMNPSSLDNQ